MGGPGRNGRAERGRQVASGRRTAILVAAALGLSGLMIGAGVAGLASVAAGRLAGVRSEIRARRDAPCRAANVTVRKPGPWGQLETRPIEIAPPRSLSRADQCIDQPPPWRLEGATPDEAIRWLESLGLPAAPAADLRSRVRCDEAGCVAWPEVAWLVGLAPDVRGRLYPALFEAGNDWMLGAIRARPGVLEARLGATSLSAATRDLVRRLLYSWDGETAFIDQAVVCAALDTQGRSEFVRYLHMDRGLIVRLRVAEGQDVSGMVAYWSRDEFGRELESLLGSLARRPGGGTIDILNLLPPVPRALLNTFPTRPDDRRDCMWTGMNFLAVEPDDRFLDGAYLSQVRNARYRVVDDAPRFGDLIEFVTRGRVVIHMAVHVADDIVFTKNGVNPAQPWILATLDQVKEQYASTADATIQRLRRIDP